MLEEAVSAYWGTFELPVSLAEAYVVLERNPQNFTIYIIGSVLLVVRRAPKAVYKQPLPLAACA